MAKLAPIVLVVAVAACAGSGSVQPSPATLRPSSPRAPAHHMPLFEFHSGFWVNLHQSLHYAATARRPPPAGAPAAPTAPAWTAAVDYYKQRFGAKGGFGVLFDEELVALNRRLSELGASEQPTGIDAELAAHLVAAADLVRDRWPEQDQANHRWVAALEPFLEAHGESLRDELVALFGTPWPEHPMRVDVACFAGPVGAYTVDDPVHITISSCDLEYTGAAALEMIFHEASHALIWPIEEKIRAEAARLGREPPRNLWHAVIFYTTGELARQRLGPDYVPYAVKNDLWGGPMGELDPLQREWQPYLEGRRSLDAAIQALVGATSP